MRLLNQTTKSTACALIIVGALVGDRIVVAETPKDNAAWDSRSRLPKTQALLAAGQPLKIVCFGDSVTGVYYHSGGRRAYTKMVGFALEQLYPNADITMVNAGISGHATDNALQRIDTDVLQLNPQLVTVMYGLNDIVRVPLDAFRTNLVEIIARCRKSGAEVLLCTPNSILETSSRPVEKLEQYCEAIREVGREQQVPVCDCYATYEVLHGEDPLAWRLLLSDELHPNMDGHKLIAEAIAHAITGRQADLKSIGPPQPGIPRTIARITAGEPIRVLAMPPFDKTIEPAIKKIDPGAMVNVTSWPTTGKSLLEIEESAKQVRGMEVDLVLLAVPASASQKTREQLIRSFTWIMNHSLSFGHQAWDVVMIAPSVVTRQVPSELQETERLMRHLVRAQDLSMIDRESGKVEPAEDIVAEWFSEQLSNSRDN